MPSRNWGPTIKWSKNAYIEAAWWTPWERKDKHIKYAEWQVLETLVIKYAKGDYRIARPDLKINKS